MCESLSIDFEIYNVLSVNQYINNKPSTMTDDEQMSYKQLTNNIKRLKRTIK